MSDLYGLFAWLVLVVVAAIGLAALVRIAVAACRAWRRRRDRRDVVIDLTYLEQAVRRTEAEGRRSGDDQLRSLGGHRSAAPRVGDR